MWHPGCFLSTEGWASRTCAHRRTALPEVVQKGARERLQYRTLLVGHMEEGGQAEDGGEQPTAAPVGHTVCSSAPKGAPTFTRWRVLRSPVARSSQLGQLHATSDPCDGHLMWQASVLLPRLLPALIFASSDEAPFWALPGALLRCFLVVTLASARLRLLPALSVFPGFVRLRAVAATQS